MGSGMGMGLGSIPKLSKAETRSISPENVYGEKGKGGMAPVGDTPQEEVARIGQNWVNNRCARDLGRKWKVRPSIRLSPESTTTLMDVEGPAVIQHLWVTVDSRFYRDLVLRIYWDGQEAPSVEAPLGDFFCNGWAARTNILALPINVNPSGGFNCYFPMPFREHVRVTIENLAPEIVGGLYYTINYALTEVDDDDGYFHARFRRTNPLPSGEDYVIVDDVRGQGHYAGVYMAWQQNNAGWWGEGEIKMFLDGDREFPTLCGTGTEDYFGGAWGFEDNFTAPFLGYPLGSCDGRPGNRHGLYRFHILDPVRFRSGLRVTMQALGWRKEGRYLPLRDDISSVCYWYQTLPHHPFPPFLSRDELEVV